MDKDELEKWLKTKGCVKAQHVVPGKPEESHVVWRIKPEVLELLISIVWDKGWDEAKGVYKIEE